jgi:hypothetical protein
MRQGSAWAGSGVSLDTLSGAGARCSDEAQPGAESLDDKSGKVHFSAHKRVGVGSRQQ